MRTRPSIAVTLAAAAATLVFVAAGDDGLPPPRLAVPDTPVAQSGQTPGQAGLAGVWRIKGRDVRLGFYMGRIRFDPQPDGTYHYERRLELTARTRRSLPESLLRETGKAWFDGGRLRTQQTITEPGLLQAMAAPSLIEGPEPQRVSAYLSRQQGESLQGVTRVKGTGLSGLERLDRVPRDHDHVVDLLIDGYEVFPLLKSELASAQRSICLQTFIFTDDSTGHAVAEILMAKARAQIPVRVLVDAAGDRMGKAFEKELRDAGVELIVQHSYVSGVGNSLLGVGRGIMNFFRGLFGGKTQDTSERRGLFNHDHRKIIVVDGRVGFIGGMNIGHEYEKVWHDVHTRVRGSVVHEMEEMFFDRWRAAGGKGSATPKSECAPAPLDGYLPVELVGALPGVTTAIKQRYLQEIRGAQNRVLIEMAYFLDDDIIDALESADRRGVRTVLILPPDADHDVPLVRDAFAHVQNDVVRSGIEVYKYKGRFLHTKVASFDGRVATVGSSNLDNMALTKLAEANVFVRDAGFAREVDERIFATDVPRSVRVKVQKLGWWKKIKSFSLHAVRGFL